ncbi:NAD(P)H-binding protein [Galenea microaerophila]
MILGKQVVMIGGTGFVGRAILYALSKAGYHCKVLVRRPERYRDLLLFKNTQIGQCSPLTDAISLARQLAGADIVINLSADLSSGTEAITLEALAAVNRSLRKAIQQSEVKRVLTLSYLGADASQTEDAWRQALGELEAMMQTLENAPSTIMRAGLLIGEQDGVTSRYQQQLKLLPFLPVPHGKTLVQPLWIKDFARAFVNLVPNFAAAGKRFEAAGEERLTLVDLAKTVAELMGKEDAMVFPMCSMNAKLMAKMGRLAPIRSSSEAQLMMLNQDMVTDQDFQSQFGFEPACLEHALSTYVVPNHLRARYNFLRREAGRDPQELAILDIENPVEVP